MRNEGDLKKEVDLPLAGKNQIDWDSQRGSL